MKAKEEKILKLDGEKSSFRFVNMILNDGPEASDVKSAAEYCHLSYSL